MKTLKISRIRIDGGTQQRRINQEIVAHYADIIPQLPPIEVVFDGKIYWLWDGFHRYYASLSLQLDSIKANVRNGTQRDALWLSFSANAAHGLPRTAKERRYILSRIFSDSKWGLKSLRTIADHVGVSHSSVQRAKSFSNATPDSESPTEEPTEDMIDEPAKITHREPELLTDKTGRAIPDQISEIFLQRGIITKLIQKLDEVLHEIEARKNNRDHVIAWINILALKADITNARRNLAAAKPYAVCPYCGAENEKCQACKGLGFVGKLLYDQAPAEIKI